jgi:S1-C subfamily serine protease
LGDIIVGLDSDTVDSESDLFKALEKHRIGETITLKVWDTYICVYICIGMLS